jgi:hypothetical protein
MCRYIKLKRQQDGSTASLLAWGASRRLSADDPVLPLSPERAAGQPALRVLVVDDNSTSQQAGRCNSIVSKGLG